MTIIKADTNGRQKLVNKPPSSTPDLTLNDLTPTKKRAYIIRRIAEPRIRDHKVNGKPYYYFCQGTDKEIYLGDAAAILRAVKGAK